MFGIKKIIPFGMVFLILSMVFDSCIQDNLTAVRLDDDTRWQPDLSLPVGEGTLSVNDYFEDFTVLDTFPLDTFPVYYEDLLYDLDVIQIETEYSFDYSLSNYIDSASYIKYLSVHTSFWNDYPTNSEIQLYFRNATGEVLDSLFDSPAIIEGGIPDNEERVVEARQQDFTVEFDRQKIQRIFPADNLKIEARIFVLSDDLEEIRFYSEYEVRAEVAMRVKLSIAPSGLEY